ncbi:DUF1501 domain-containing protein [Schlesneria sp. DSM 10557]|uniref:DUF1501 domain-containing protein n=1 Tax=Schlesneria sp. DSM 10557 TaxID=3044399 RepID=UPI00359FF695
MLRAFTPLSRRTCLQVGGLSALGLSVSQLRANRGDARETQVAATTQPKGAVGASPTGTARACIMLYMLGGAPQQETFDMKPEAPGPARSLFPTISTNVPGIDICGLLPNLAHQADRLAIIRSVYHGGNALFHGAGVHYNLTGFPNVPREGEPFLDRRDYPAVGAVLNQLRGSQRGLPAAVQLPMWITQDGPGREWAGQSAGFLGRKYDPLVMDYGYFKLNEDFNNSPGTGEASLPGMMPPGFQLQKELLGGRLEQRLELQSRLGQQKIGAGTPLLRDWMRQQTQALDVLGAESTWKGFDIEHEPVSLREKYGNDRLGRSCLVARRLVEAGVSLVTVIFGGWDTHSHHLEHTRDRLLPPLNRAFGALLDDLADRGLLETTLVAWTGDFGRTPVINGNSPPGRDHWANVYSTVLAGGGIQGGQVYGKSDKLAAEPIDNPVPVGDFVATIYHALGYDGDTTVVDPFDRPHHVMPGRPLTGLF